MYEKVPNEPSVLVNTIMKAFEKIRLRSDFPSDILNYFLVKNLKISRFYLISKIHKCLHNAPDRQISNTDFCIGNMDAFLDYHLQPLAQKVKYYIKETNRF